MSVAVCKRCGVEKEISEFYTDPTKRDGHRYSCKVCDRARKRPAGYLEQRRQWQRAYRESVPEAYLLTNAKYRAKKEGIQFALKLSDVSIPKYCPVFGVELERSVSGYHGNASPSLDRIDPSKGYVPGNVRVISFRANRLKGDATISEIEAILSYMRGGSKA